MSIRFNMTDAQQAALDQLLANQQNPSSPLYRQWLTPAQYAAQFGLSSADMAKVSAWLTGEGFTVTAVGNGGTFISFDGSVGQAQAAFSTSIHNLSLNGETHFANVTDVQVPSAFAGVVGDVTGLHNFRLQARAHASIAQPNFTSSGSHYLAPGDIYTIYNVTPLLATYNGSGIGMGTNCHSTDGVCGDIAVTGQVDIYTADIAAFRSAAGLSAINLTTVHAAGVDPGPPECNSCDYEANQGDLAESSIDLEWSGAMAPSAAIVFVNAPCDELGTGCGTDAMTWAIDNDQAPIVTTSYGACEAGWGTADLTTEQLLFKQANAQGQTVVAAAADHGATDCDEGPIASQGLQVDFPGSSPNVTSMGGSQFNEGNATGATSFWSVTNGTTGGSALSYIPEAAWNDETEVDVYGGGGGGASAFFTKPAWQVGTGVPTDGARDVPDLVMNASDAHDPLLLCVNTAAAEGGESCTSGFSSSYGLAYEGGTSFDSQIFGGMLALIEQKIGARIGNANPVIYALANSAAYYTPGQTTAAVSTVVFNDVTTGTNAMPCNQGTPNCGNGGTTGFSAGSGFDLSTGWGSPNLSNLANAWSKVTPLGSGSLGVNASATTLNASASSVASGATVTLTATVTGSAATPTGTVLFLANNVALASGVPFSASSGGSAIATYSWVTSCSNLGQNVMSASYSGDINYQGSIGGAVLTTNGATQLANGTFEVNTPVEVQVATSNCPDFSLTPSASSFTVAAGGSIPIVTIAAAALNGFTGTVTFTATSQENTAYAPILTLSATTITIPSSTQSTTLTFSGITANLRMPHAPGSIDSGTMLVEQGPTRPLVGRKGYAAGSGVAIASLLLLVLPRRRRLGSLLLLVLSVALIGGATGCGSSQAGPPSSSTTSSDLGTYIVTVTGVYTNATTHQVTTHSTTITYVIN
jgi:subtilase family serine protease